MKAKRFLSILVAVLMLVSCFAIGASADEKNPIIDTTKDVTLTITLYDTATNRADNSGNFNTEIIAGDTDVAGTEQTVSSYEGIAGSKFEIRLQKADGTYPEAATAYGTTNEDGVLTFTYTGDNDNAANTTTKLAQGRYKVTNSEKAQTQVAKILDFEVDLPMTNPAGDDWMYDVYVYPKIPTDTTKPEVQKSVSNDGTNFGHEATINAINDSAATWKITSTLPEGINNYKALKFTDVVDPRLIVVENEGTKVTTVSYDGTALTKETDYTVTWSKVKVDGKDVYDKLKVEFTAVGISKLAANKTITITYQTMIDTSIDSAVATYIGNHVILDYENSAGVEGTVDNTPDNTTDDNFDPDDSTTYPGTQIEIPDPEDPDETITVTEPSTPGDNTNGKDDKDPYIYTGKIEVVKIKQGDTTTKLEGVEFALLDASKNPVKDENNNAVTATTDANGVFSFVGLKTGTYYLRETKTIAGYELIGEDIAFEITKTNLDYKDDTTGILHTDNNINYIDNIPSTKLPLTGGMGVGMFALIGFAFAAAGSAFFFKSKKVSD